MNCVTSFFSRPAGRQPDCGPLRLCSAAGPGALVKLPDTRLIPSRSQAPRISG